MKKHSFFLRSLPVLMLMAAFCSCVNEDYDLDKDIDMNVNVLKNVSVPIGSLEKVTLSDILEVSDNMSFFEVDSEGNLAILISGENNKLSQEVTVPFLTFENSYRGETYEEYLGDFYFTYDPAFSDLINLDNIRIPRAFPDIPLLIEFEKEEIPDQIKDIRYAEVDATATVSLSVRVNAELPFTAYIAEGTEFIFPDWVVLGDVSGNMKKEGHKVILLEDIAIPVSTPESPADSLFLAIPVSAVDGNKLPEGQGITADRKFIMKDYMTIRGKSFFTFDGNVSVDGGIISPVVTSIVTFSDLGINSVEVKLGDDVEKDLVSGLSPITLEDIPDILKNSDISLDVNDIRVDVDFLNSSPFGGYISAVIETSAEGKTLDNVNIGPVHFDAGSSSLPSQMRWSFSEGKLQAPDGYVLYTVNDMTDIIMNIPETVEFKDVEVDLDDEFVLVRPGETYVLEQNYSIYAPLAFGPDFHIPYTYEITDLDLSFPAADLESAVLDMDVESSIPMNFNASAYATDENGEVIDGLKLTLKDNSVLKAGSLDSPTLSHLTFVLANETGKVMVDNVVIHFAATAPGSDLIGIPLNQNQGLYFKNIVLTLPEGISADLNEI